MRAKDTVMSDKEIKQITGGTHRDFPEGLRICQAQAEISFKAGIKEVVEWVNSNAQQDAEECHGSLTLDPNEWQWQLKEWGISWGIDE